MKAIRHSPVSDHTITASCMDMYNAPKPVSLEIFSIRIVFIIFSVQLKLLMMDFSGGIISGSDHTVIISKLFEAVTEFFVEPWIHNSVFHIFVCHQRRASGIE